jgi:hypothetical protein
VERIKQKRLQWYGHVKRMEKDRLPNTVVEWEKECRRRKGRPLGKLIDGIRYSIEKYGLK